VSETTYFRVESTEDSVNDLALFLIDEECEPVNIRSTGNEENTVFTISFEAQSAGTHLCHVFLQEQEIQDTVVPTIYTCSTC
jgi:hypothetical protein